MAVRIVDKRAITSVDQLNDSERAQLRVLGKLYDGDDLPAEQRLEGEEEGSFGGFCHLWKVVDGDTHLYDAWFIMVDSGGFFRVGTTQEVASVIQFGLECADPDLRLQLGAAMVEAGLLPKADSSYDELAEALAKQS